MGYDGDSFFTLSSAGQAGLAVLSFCLAIGMIVLTGWLARGHRPILRIAIWLAAFTAFLALSPQVYYTYYRVIIPGLPLQWVVAWPDPLEALRLLAFADRPTLSAHGRGILGWLMLIAALVAVRFKTARR
ncbi:MAG: hypothetical protein AAFP68_04875 [Pseudomonadota bacterium]